MKYQNDEIPNWQLHLVEILRGYNIFDYNELNRNLNTWLQSWSDVLEKKNKDWFYNQLKHLGLSNYKYAGKEEIEQSLKDGWSVLSIQFKPRFQSPFCVIMRYAPDDQGLPSLQYRFTEKYGIDNNLVWVLSWSQVEVIPETEPITKEGFVLTQVNLCFESYMKWAHEKPFNDIGGLDHLADF